MHSEHPAGPNLTRRSLLSMGPAALGLAVTGAVSQKLLTATAQIEGNARGDMPTYGGMRPGPVGLQPARVRRKGVNPVAMRIEKAAVDAQIESQAIQDGVMLDPSGPFVVAWYPDTGKLGEEKNLVFSGHVDYYNVGAAVFYNLKNLVEGDVIQLIGEDEETYDFAVDWSRNYTVDQLDSAAIREIVGNTDDENITLITCGGAFDFNIGQYLERFVVRASRSDG